MIDLNGTFPVCKNKIIDDIPYTVYIATELLCDETFSFFSDFLRRIFTCFAVFLGNIGTFACKNQT